MTAVRWRSWTGFVSLAAVVYSTVFWLAGSGRAVVQWAGFFDLILTVPLLFYWMIVRATGWPVTAVIPIVLLGIRAGGFLVPAPAIGWLAAPLEIFILISVWRRIRSAPSGSGTDVVTRIRTATLALVRNKFAADILTSELAMFYYAFGSWRAKPEVPEGSRGIRYAESTALSQLLPLALFVILLEGTGMHLIIQRWSHIAAWTLTALDAYALVWVIAFWRSIHLRSILISGEALTIRLGYLMEARIERSRIASWREGAPDAKAPDFWTNARFGDARILLQLKEPVPLKKLFCRTKQVSTMAIAADDPDELKIWLALKD
jgi:hypothetical protein